MTLSAHYDAIAQCNRCGFCQAACPVFRATGQEAGVARGRLALLRALIEKRIAWSRELEDPLFACLSCGACTAHCFPAIPAADLILAAREEYLEKVERKRSHRILFDRLLPYPHRLRLAVKAARLGKRSGLSAAARALGLLRIFGRDFPKAEGILDRFPEAALRERTRPGLVAGGPGGPRIGYFAGCGMDLIFPEAARASLEILRRAGGELHVLDNVCCGLPPLSYGDRRAARALGKRNLEVLAGSRFDAIVTDCSSCASFLKKYPKLFPEGDELHAAAREVAGRVRDLAEWAAPGGLGQTAGAETLKVTYHDPCHASRGQGLVRPPRELLRVLPGVEYLELPEANWCCGGAGSYALYHYELSMKVLERKMERVRSTGAQVLATSCPACIIQLSHGARLFGLSIRVVHLSELLSGQLRRDGGTP